MVWIYLAHALSLSRAALALPLYFLISNNYNMLSVVLIIWAMVSDYLDGFVARAFNHNESWGIILDPLCDKIFLIGLCAGYANLASGIGLMYLRALIFKEVVVMITCGLMLLKRVQIDRFKPAFIGKVSTSANLVSFIAVLFDTLADFFLAASMALSAQTGLLYLSRLRGLLRKHGP